MEGKWSWSTRWILHPIFHVKKGMFWLVGLRPATYDISRWWDLRATNKQWK